MRFCIKKCKWNGGAKFILQSSRMGWNPHLVAEPDRGFLGSKYGQLQFCSDLKNYFYNYLDILTGIGPFGWHSGWLNLMLTMFSRFGSWLSYIIVVNMTTMPNVTEKWSALYLWWHNSFDLIFEMIKYCWSLHKLSSHLTSEDNSNYTSKISNCEEMIKWDN